MTRKHYVMLAEAMKNSFNKADDHWESWSYNENYQLEYEQWKNCCNTIADTLAVDNPKFDRDRFLKACGID